MEPCQSLIKISSISCVYKHPCWTKWRREVVTIKLPSATNEPDTDNLLHGMKYYESRKLRNLLKPLQQGLWKRFPRTCGWHPWVNIIWDVHIPVHNSWPTAKFFLNNNEEVMLWTLSAFTFSARQSSPKANSKAQLMKALNQKSMVFLLTPLFTCPNIMKVICNQGKLLGPLEMVSHRSHRAQ